MASSREQQRRTQPQLKEKFSLAATSLAELYKESTHAYEEGYRDALRAVRSYLLAHGSCSSAGAGGRAETRAPSVATDSVLRHMESLQFERRELHRAARGGAKHYRSEGSEDRDSGDAHSSESEGDRTVVEVEQPERPSARGSEGDADVSVGALGAAVLARDGAGVPLRRRRRLYAPHEHQLLSILLED